MNWVIVSEKPSSIARETATVRCPDCGETREISIRQKRRLMNEGGKMLCSVCRTLPRPAKVTLKHKRFWLDSYSMEWIRETAEMIWGEENL